MFQARLERLKCRCGFSRGSCVWHVLKPDTRNILDLRYLSMLCRAARMEESAQTIDMEMGHRTGSGAALVLSNVLDA